MKIDLFDIDEFVKVNSCPEVTNPIHFETDGRPTDDGLFSTTIFGNPGSYDRKTVFAYVDLKDWFLHPVVYRFLARMDRRIPSLVDGSRYFRLLDDGSLEEDPEAGKTGLKWLHSVFDRLKVKETGSESRSAKIDLLSRLGKKESFVRKWLVVPAMLRDVNLSGSARGRPSVDPINSLYASLIASCSGLGDGGVLDLGGDRARARVQSLLLEIYDCLIGQIPKKSGYIHKAVIGKPVDLSTRAVISSAPVNSEDWTSQKVPFDSVGVPLSHALNLFLPFVQKEAADLARYVYGATADREPALAAFTPEAVRRMVQRYIKTPDLRFSPVEVPKGGGSKSKIRLEFFSKFLGRPLTVTDLLYYLAARATEGKYAYITRYPVENYQSIFPAKVRLLSTYKTKEETIDGVRFPEWPDVAGHSDAPEHAFLDTCLLNAAYLRTLGADFDGDTISIRGLFTQEANAEAAAAVVSKKNLLDANGQNVRYVDSKEPVLALYNLTRS